MSRTFSRRVANLGAAWWLVVYSILGSGDVAVAAGAAQTVTTDTIDYGNLEFPATMTVAAGAASDAIYGQVYKAGVTEAPGPDAGIVAQLGYGPDGSDPSGVGWTWVAATFNMQANNNDEYSATLTVPTPGVYDYAYRYAYGTGPWLYGDLDGKHQRLLRRPGRRAHGEVDK